MYRHSSGRLLKRLFSLYVCTKYFMYLRWDKAQRARGKKECLLILILVENEIIFYQLPLSGSSYYVFL